MITPRRRGFTLLELMLAVAILAAVTTVTYLTFSTVSQAWQRGLGLTESIHHGDFVIEQIVLGLRSSYFPETGQDGSEFGFYHEDGGEGWGNADTISWVKIGSALIGQEAPYAGSPHRVKLTLEDDEGRTAVAVRSWRVKGQPEDFDPDDVAPVFLSTRVEGFNCRAAYQMVDEEIDWMDEWEHTNKLPTVVELTLYLAPLEEGGDPVEVRRLLGIRAAELCWRSGAAPGKTDAARRRRTPRTDDGAEASAPRRGSSGGDARDRTAPGAAARDRAVPRTPARRSPSQPGNTRTPAAPGGANRGPPPVPPGS